MSRHLSTLPFAALSLSLAFALFAALAGRTTPPPSSHRAAALASYARRPLAFEANQGQCEGGVKFLARGQGYRLFLTPGESVLSLSPPRRPRAEPEGKRGTAERGGVERESGGVGESVLSTRLLGANPHPKLVGTEKQRCQVSYFRGNDPRKWRVGVPTYARVKYADVYPGVDLVYYGNQQQLEYDYLIRPGADPARIAFQVEGAERLELAPNGDLVLHTPEGGEVRDHRPVCYQEVDGRKVPVDGKYLLLSDQTTTRHPPLTTHPIGFEIAAYDRTRPLVIDPILAYSTYLASDSDEVGNAIAIDGNGGAYVTGYTLSGGFPVKNAYQTAHSVANGQDVFVTRLDTTAAGGASLVYSTYLGGSMDDGGQGIAVDGQGNAYVVGHTSSGDFPVKNAFQGAHSADSGAQDAFVTKVKTTDSGAASLVYSTYLGGDKEDDGLGIAVDASQNAYVTGYTSSTNFPTQGEYMSDASGTGQDVFVTKLDTTASGAACLLYSTYLAGSVNDVGQGIAVDGGGNAYVAGWTTSSDFPTKNGYPSIRSQYDAFVARLDPSAAGVASLVYSTYLGSSRDDQGFAIAVDDSGNAYVTGRTSWVDFPAKNQYQGYMGFDDVFVTRVDTKLAGAASLVYSTYLGGTDFDNGLGIATDGAGGAYVTGWTLSTGFPKKNELQSDMGFVDAFVTKLDTTAAGAASLSYSTYLGGNSYDEGLAIAVDGNGNAYATGYTVSSDFPTLNACDARDNNADVFVTRFNAASFHLGSSAAAGTEGQTLQLSVTRTGDLTAAAMVPYALAPVTATAGLDYTDTSGALSFIAGQATALIPLPLLADSLLEGPETFTVTLNGTSQGVLGSPASATVTINDDLTAPAPAGLSAGVTGPGRVTLSITDHCGNEDDFRLERGLKGSGFSEIAALFAKSGTGTTFSFADTTVVATKSYSYRVRARKGTIYSAYSSVVDITVNLPTAPTLTSVTVLSARQVNLHWQDNSLNEQNFRIDAMPAGGSFAPLLTLAPGATAASPAGLTPDTDYTFRVVAVNGAGETASNTLLAHTFAAPAPPTSLTASPFSSSQIRLVWNSGGAHTDFYQLERSTDGVNFSKIATMTKTVLAYSDSGLSQGATYTYRVRSISGTSLASASLFALGAPSAPAAAAPLSPPTAPTNLQATGISATQIRLTWQDGGSNTDRFRVERQSGSSWTLLATLGKTILSYTDNGLQINHSFTFRVSAIAGIDLTDSRHFLASAPAGPVTTNTLAAPAAPTGLTTTAQAGKKIQLAWVDHATTETGYQVERSTDGGTSFTEIAQPAANATSYQDTGLTAGQAYFYRVRAVSGGAFSAFSNVANATASP